MKGRRLCITLNDANNTMGIILYSRDSNNIDFFNLNYKVKLTYLSSLLPFFFRLM